MVPSLFLNSMRVFLVFGPKNFSLSQFLEVAQVKGTNPVPCIVCEYFCFSVKIFFFDIAISGGRIGEREVSTVPE